MARLAALAVVALAAAAFAPTAQAKVSFTVASVVTPGSFTVRVAGCSSAKPCAWAKGLVIKLAPTGKRIPTGPLLRVGKVNSFGLLRGRIPAMPAGTYNLVSEARTVTYRDGRSHRVPRVFVSNQFAIS